MSSTVVDMTTASFASQRSKTSVLGADSGLGLPAMVLKCVATADKVEFNASSPLPVRVATSPLENALKKSTPPLISLACHPPVRQTHSQFLHHFNSQKMLMKSFCLAPVLEHSLHELITVEKGNSTTFQNQRIFTPFPPCPGCK